MCLRFVREMFGIPAGAPDAATAWHRATVRHEGDRNPPDGVAAFYLGGSAGHGHVAITEDGGIRGTDAPTRGRVGFVPLDWPERHWNMRYVGWTEDINDVPIPADGALTVFLGNMGSKDRVGRLLTVLEQHKPDVAVLSEAYHLRDDLAEIPGYTRVQYSAKHGPEAPDVAVLVRHGVRIKRRALRKMLEAWWGPFTGKRRAPRRGVVVVLVLQDGTKWPMLAGHGPSGGPSGGVKTRGRNRPAWLEFAKVCRRFLRLRRRAVVVADFNADKADVRKHAAPKRADVCMSSNVDGVAVVGGTARLHQLEDPADMHGWALVTLNPR
jgi:hypothetical protein